MLGKSFIKKLGAILFWVLVWQIAATAVGHQILLASPLQTLKRFGELAVTAAFWRTALFTAWRILLGFFAAVAIGALLAGLSARFQWIRELIGPLLATLKSIPVASFIIVALIWISSRQLSLLISFVIALPVVYSGALGGIAQVNPELLEMAQVFRLSAIRRILFLYIPAALPHFRVAAGVAMGLAWKSAVAAEVIGIPTGSIGEKLYTAKVYLATPDLFAWTLAIVLMSFACERLFLKGMDLAISRVERM